jgi:acetate kinase
MTPPTCATGPGPADHVRLLVVNTGSSSLKLRVLDAGDATLVQRDVEWPPDAPVPGEALEGLPDVDAVAHRVVHGGDAFRAAIWIDAQVRARLGELTALAPLHQPRALAAIDATGRALAGVRAAACFDTAFHATLPAAAATYALPAQWRGRWNLRRYGFHGLSHAYVSRRAAELVGRPADELRIVSCHLGAGASLAAIAAGRSVDTTMGFTPLEGLVMASRAGSVDPGLLVWLLQNAGLAVDELADKLEHRSGLAGLAGTRDMREVLERRDDAARLALDVFVHRLRAGIAAMAAAMDGLDVLAFTGGIGENEPAIRQAAAAGLGFLGVRLDGERNAAARGDADIGELAAPVAAVVITAREDREIARQVRALT